MSFGRLRDITFGKSVATRVACVVFAALLAVGMCACKPTDFFIEKIIAPQAEQVDENNENTIVINSPDAEEESKTLAALDWSDDSLRTQTVQNLVTWSSTPNSLLTTHRSIFDLNPRYSGIFASDGVALNFQGTATTSEDVDSDENVDRDDVTSTSSGTSADSSSTPTEGGATSSSLTVEGEDTTSESADNGSSSSSDASGDSSQSNKEGSNSGGSAEGGDTSGEGSGSYVSPDPDPEPGRTPDYAGYGGNVRYYSPNNKKDTPPEADSVAVIGTQVAAAVQALGGKGAISAMSTFDYSYSAVNTTGSFQSVYGSSSDEWDESSVFLWDSGNSTATSVDFSAYSDATAAEEWAKTIGYDGVVFYDQALITNIDDVLPENLKYETYGYNITFVPLDFRTLKESTFEGSIYAIGQVLKNSHANGVAAQDVEGMSNEFMDFMEVVTNELPSVLGSYAGNVYLNVATDATHAIPVTANGIRLGSEKQLVLFADYGQDSYTPLNQWMADAGIKPMTDGTSTESSAGPGHLAFLDPSDGAFTTLEGASSAVLSNWMEVKSTGKQPVNAMNKDEGPNTSGGSKNGLGSACLPYLVVTGTSDGSMTNTEVRDQACRSIESFVMGWGATLYSAMDDDDAFDVGFGKGSTIGKVAGSSSNILTSEGVIENTVHANPNGVLGSWTDASFESILESVWLAGLFSEAPSESSPYQPNADWKNVKVTLGDTTIDGSSTNDGREIAQQVVTAFYERFYRTASYTSPDLDY